MHSDASFVAEQPSADPEISVASDLTERVLHHARRLHRAARSASISTALPVIRRIHASGQFPQLNVAALFRQRAQLQRKHVLHMLAIEAGHLRWERYRDVLPTLTPEQVAPAHLTDRWPASINVWFANEAQARAAVGEGATLLRFGTQFVLDGACSERMTVAASA